MNRSGRALSTLIALVGIFKLLLPAAAAQLFALDTPVALLALITAIIAYGVWYGPLKFLAGSSLTRLLGLTVLVAGIASLNSPTLMGIRSTYLPLADMFLIVESGIVLQLIGLENKRAESLSPMLALGVISQLVMRRFSRPALTATAASPSH